jgi:hypothetical protein
MYSTNNEAWGGGERGDVRCQQQQEEELQCLARGPHSHFFSSRDDLKCRRAVAAAGATDTAGRLLGDRVLPFTGSRMSPNTGDSRECSFSGSGATGPPPARAPTEARAPAERTRFGNADGAVGVADADADSVADDSAKDADSELAAVAGADVAALAAFTRVIVTTRGDDAVFMYGKPPDHCTSAASSVNTDVGVAAAAVPLPRPGVLCDSVC